MPVVSFAAKLPTPRDEEPADEELDNPELEYLVEPARPPRRAWLRRRARAAIKVGSGALVVAAIAGALSSGRSPGSSTTPRGAPLRQALALEGTKPDEHMWVKRSDSTGCKNWKDLMLGAVTTESNVYTCALRCRNSKMCTGFGYQEKACSDSTKGRPKPGACSLWNGDCEPEDNPYQTDYQMEARQDPDWTLRSWGMTCSNFYDIRIGPYTIETSVSACGAKCIKNKDCIGFGYQSGSCDDPGAGALPGACYLWKGECDSSPNTCFDDYSMARSQGYVLNMTAASPPSTATTVPPASPSTTAKVTTTVMTAAKTSPTTTTRPSAPAPSVAAAVPSFALSHLDVAKLRENKSLEKQVIKVIRESVAKGIGDDVDPADVQLELMAA